MIQIAQDISSRLFDMHNWRNRQVKMCLIFLQFLMLILLKKYETKAFSYNNCSNSATISDEIPDASNALWTSFAS